MKSNRNFFVLSLFLAIWIGQAQAANRDIVQLQTQVDALQQQMTQMKQSFDERMGVMKNLLEQNTDAANKSRLPSPRCSPRSINSRKIVALRSSRSPARFRRSTTPWTNSKSVSPS
jgi:hypothetical protein